MIDINALTPYLVDTMIIFTTLYALSTLWETKKFQKQSKKLNLELQNYIESTNNMINDQHNIIKLQDDLIKNLRKTYGEKNPDSNDMNQDLT